MTPQGQTPFSMRVARMAIATGLKSGRLVDLGLGLALLRDGRIPVRTKAMAMAIALGLTTGMVALEIPLEGLLAVAVPMLGFAVDMFADGAEETVGTLLICALILPHFAPREVVALIRDERAGGLPR